MNNKPNILITVPYLNNIGGTEIEAINTLIQFYDSNSYKNVGVFAPLSTVNPLLIEMIKGRKVRFISYPSFFNSKWVLLINLILKKIKIKVNIFEIIFWFFITFKFKNIFILCYSNSTYFYPILFWRIKIDKIIAKITMWHFNIISEKHIKPFQKLDAVLVFNDKQNCFWKENYKLNNIKTLDITIPNEINLLNVKDRLFERTELTLGYIGRISREKNIEDSIHLVDTITKKNIKCKLKIVGKGEDNYVNEIKKLIDNLNLNKLVDFEQINFSPLESHKYYEQIDVFLVTSHHEGGPMTALEAVASGCFILSYDIGAMKDRFENFPFVINNNFDKLCQSAIDFSQMSDDEKINLTKNLRKHYLNNLSNKEKFENLKTLFK